MFGRSTQKGKSTSKNKPQSVVSWNISFENMLEDPAGLRVFTDFLKREFSGENIMFWIACKQYSKLTDRYQMIKLAKEIYDLHLRPGAPEAVNINSKTRQYVLSNLSNPPSDLFHQAEREVFTLMKFDCYQRFLKSDLFVECLTAEKLGKPLPCNSVEGSKSPSGTRFRSKSRDRHRVHPKKANSTNYGSSNNELNVISDDGNSTTRRSFLSCKKDINAVWNRLQQRMDDQRGTELQCDIPEFLRCPQESSSVI